MFSRDSRYARLDDIAVTDSRGRTLVTKVLRLPPDVDGQFQHPVDAGDRLDHLAYKYYKQPARWWRIVDANPSFFSPLEMIGQDPVSTVNFRFDDVSTPAPFAWRQIVDSVTALPGVLSALPRESVVSHESAPETIGPDTVLVTRERYERLLTVTFNLELVSVSDIKGALELAGFSFSEPEPVGRIGKPVVIPSNTLRP